MSPHAMRAASLAASAVAGCLLLPGAAWAGSARVVTKDASVRGDPVTEEVVSRLVFEARPGERNRLRVSVGAGAFTVTDSVPIVAGRGCRRRSRNVVRCKIVEKASSLSARLGDRSDLLRVSGPLRQGQDGGDTTLRISGGAGHDRILLGRRTGGFPFTATLKGGRGNDLLDSPGSGSLFVGGPGNDVMLGGRGPDFFDEGARANGSDTIVGRKQFTLLADEVSYERRRRGVRADLDGRRDDGAPGERDRIAPDVERLTGGSGGDRLTGNARNNDLAGAGGRDALSGLGANDTLDGGLGSDRLSGGDGRDLLEGGGEVRDTLRGGPGNDSLSGRGPDLVSGGTGFDSVGLLGGAPTVDLRDGGRDTVSCRSQGQELLRLDALDFFVSGPEASITCDRVERDGEALALFSGSPEVDSFSGEPVALIEMGCPADAAPTCSARVQIEMDGRTFEPVEYNGERNTSELLQVPIDPAVVGPLNSTRQTFRAFVLVSARRPAGGTVERRHPIVLGTDRLNPGFR